MRDDGIDLLLRHIFILYHIHKPYAGKVPPKNMIWLGGKTASFDLSSCPAV